MTGPQDDARPDPDEGRVRDLLADLGSSGAHSPGAVPDHVARRLDSALAGLPSLAGTAPTAVHRPRRRAGLLAAAAAVVVVVGGGGLVLGQGGGPMGAGDSASSESAAGGSTADGAAAGAPALTSDTLRRDVRRVLAQERSAARGTTADTTLEQLGCTAPDGPGETRAVTLDGEPAVLLLRQTGDGATSAQVWSCDGGRVLARTRLPG